MRWFDKALLLGAALTAAIGSLVSLLLAVTATRATTTFDAVGPILVAVAFSIVPWAAVWATARSRYLVAIVCFVLTGVGFALLARDGFPTIGLTIASVLLALGVGWSAREASREASDDPGSPEEHRVG